MSQLLQLFIIIPLTGLIISLLVPRKKETVLSLVAISTMSVHMCLVLAFGAYWLLNGYPVLDIRHIVLFSTEDFEIFISFFFDKITAVHAFTGSVLTFLVVIFSRYYLHREAGFKRFFTTLLFFYTGYNIVIFSGNFETFFIGWEVLGITSFLLIAFYRDRYLPVKNGFKVISLYRFSDVCLLLAMWMSHHLWHENITFAKLNEPATVAAQIGSHYPLALFISFMLLVAAAVKSAQAPFSSWLPRAMEGPTTSSAIFYGSLSVHLGVFLLLRTYPFWESLVLVKVAVVLIGLSTSLIANTIARVQSSVKTQIAYSSVTQIGLIFIEVGLGFHTLALVHFTANAFLRAYQLLVSPSVLSYLIHDQFYNFKPGAKAAETSTLFKKISYSLYILSIKEWNLDHLLTRYMWSPFKWLGGKLGFISTGGALLTLCLIFPAGLYVFFSAESVPAGIREFMSVLFSLIPLTLLLKAFTERKDAIRAWLLVFFSQFFIALSISLASEVEFRQILIYLSGSSVAAIIGYICLGKIRSIDNSIGLDRYHGYSYEQPGISFLFLFACLGLLGFPITPSFIGVDVLFSHIKEEQPALIILNSLCFIFTELAVLRIYIRIFLGQHKKAYHPIAYRSS